MKLKVGDRVRIVAVPEKNTPNCTIRVFKRLMDRKGSVRISRVEKGVPWFDCKFLKWGRWEYHSLALLPGEEHLWKKVNARKRVSK